MHIANIVPYADLIIDDFAANVIDDIILLHLVISLRHLLTMFALILTLMLIRHMKLMLMLLPMKMTQRSKC
jgi:hypothetical protein